MEKNGLFHFLLSCGGRFNFFLAENIESVVQKGGNSRYAYSKYLGKNIPQVDNIDKEIHEGHVEGKHGERQKYVLDDLKMNPIE